MAGTFVAQPNLQAMLWAIDGAGLVMAAAVLTLKYFRTEHDLVAAGFLVFAIAEAVMLSGTAGGPAASVPSFGAGTCRGILMPGAELYEDDRALARDRGHRFDVARKNERGMCWIEIECNIADLHDAMALARDTKAYETAVFVQGGFLYWTSVHPEIFNSTVIAMRLERQS